MKDLRKNRDYLLQKVLIQSELQGYCGIFDKVEDFVNSNKDKLDKKEMTNALISKVYEWIDGYNGEEVTDDIICEIISDWIELSNDYKDKDNQGKVADKIDITKAKELMEKAKKIMNKE